jgi:hypothetical protein
MGVDFDDAPSKGNYNPFLPPGKTHGPGSTWSDFGPWAARTGKARPLFERPD